MKKTQSKSDQNTIQDTSFCSYPSFVLLPNTGNEAQFIFAVAANARGDDSGLSNDEYDKLKADLQKANSWVVNRGQDPLEKLGLNTFMGYLHRELKLES